MTPGISADGNRLTLRLNGEILQVEPWGSDGVRVRATKLRSFPDIPGALAETFDAPGANAVVREGKGILTSRTVGPRRRAGARHEAAQPPRHPGSAGRDVRRSRGRARS